MQPHQSQSVARRFLISIAITTVIFLAELVGGIWTGSLALLSDSAHVFMDVFALALSFVALRLSSLPSDEDHTYGYHRVEVLAALLNGVTLGTISLGIWWEAINRFSHPNEIRTIEMLIISAVGLVANLAVALILRVHSHQGREHNHSTEDLNLHSAYLHVVGDMISSLGVILAAIAIAATGWQWLDPLASILIGALIGFSAYRITRKSLHILVEGVPEGISIHKLGTAMGQIGGVAGIHELHVWNICSTHVALSAHVILDNYQTDHADLRKRLQDTLYNQFGIEHSTLQFEIEPCKQQSNGCGGQTHQ